MYERHRPALRRQAARLLYASGHDPEDVLQDVFLRVHGALRAGVVPLEPRAVAAAARPQRVRGRAAPRADPAARGRRARRRASIAPLLPDELARRAEARALLGDIHRLPDRQRSVLVMSAIEGLSHEEVAGPAVDHRRDHPLAARPGAREPAAHRGGARDRVPCRLRRARRGRRGGRPGERDRPPAPLELHGLPRLPARAAHGALAAAAARELEPVGAASRSWSAAAGWRACRRSRSARAARSWSAAGRSPSPRSPVHARHVPQVAAVVPQPAVPAPASHPKRQRRGRPRAARPPRSVDASAPPRR